MPALTSPEQAGFAPDLDDRFEIARAAGVLPNLHGVIALRDGQIFFERYLPGTDAARARPLGVVRFGPETLHDLRSASKSVVGLLYGIALAAGQVAPPEASLLDQFPEYPDLAADPARRRLTVAHALSMTLGTEWDEMTLPYYDPRNSEIAMDNAPDRCRYILDRPIAGPPGERWTYNGGATALLGRLIARGSGRSLHDFARETLFGPLGLGQTDWECGADGEAFAASGLRMALPDVARLGVLVLAGGAWDGRQIVPRDWLAASLRPAVAMPDGRRYGYHWYLGVVATDDGAGGTTWEPTVSAVGNGGQRLFLLPRLNLVVAVLAGNYDSPEQWRPPLAVLRDVLLPALRRR
jgi:CubicO group peptidase (beta-lactamase class C family)